MLLLLFILLHFIFCLLSWVSVLDILFLGRHKMFKRKMSNITQLKIIASRIISICLLKLIDKNIKRKTTILLWNVILYQFSIRKSKHWSKKMSWILTRVYSNYVIAPIHRPRKKLRMFFKTKEYLRLQCKRFKISFVFFQ